MSVPHIVENRTMLSRTVANQFQITHILDPAQKENGCCVCFNAPQNIPCCSMLPCITYPKYITKKLNASNYAIVRENSIEYNTPKLVNAEGICCGVSLIKLDVQDDIKVIYFDDPDFDKIYNGTRWCDSCKTCLCGSDGEQVRIDSTCCFGACIKTNIWCCFAPVCCPKTCCPCTISHTIPVQDAERSVSIIKEAKMNAKKRLG